MGHVQGEEEPRHEDTESKKESRIDENRPNEGIKIKLVKLTILDLTIAIL